MPAQAAGGEAEVGVHTAYGQRIYVQQRETHPARETSGGRVDSNKLRGAEIAR